jgi:MFS family permease
MNSTADLPIRRNVFLLAAAVAMLYGSVQLVAAVATITFVLVSGIKMLLGLGPAIFLGAGALTALPAGRAMDRFGRVPVLAAGFIMGISGTMLTGLGVSRLSVTAVILGFVLIGAANASVMLARLAAADMFPPARRGRGIGLVLVGAVFGAILGPLVFMPMFAGKALAASTLVLPWFVAAGFMLTGLILVLNVRPDPRVIAQHLAALSHTDTKPAPLPAAASLPEILRRPGVPPALLAALASFAVMVSLMTLVGYILVGHGHDQDAIFPAVSAHFIGMFGLVLVVGNIVDRVGRPQAMMGGLAILAVSILALVWVDSIIATSVCMFGVGIGWNLAYVAATTELVNLTNLAERGKILGFSDLLAGLSGATLALIGGVILAGAGLTALSLVGGALVLAPALWILRSRRVHTVKAATARDS